MLRALINSANVISRVGCGSFVIFIIHETTLRDAFVLLLLLLAAVLFAALLSVWANRTPWYITPFSSMLTTKELSPFLPSPRLEILMCVPTEAWACFSAGLSSSESSLLAGGGPGMPVRSGSLLICRLPPEEGELCLAGDAVTGDDLSPRSRASL